MKAVNSRIEANRAIAAKIAEAVAKHPAVYAAREKENAFRRYTKAIGNQLAAVRAVAPAAYMLKYHRIKLVDDFFFVFDKADKRLDLPEKSDRTLFFDVFTPAVCCGRSTDDVRVAVNFETEKCIVTGLDSGVAKMMPYGGVSLNELVDIYCVYRDSYDEKRRGYCDELFDRLRRLSEGLTRFAEDVAAKISAAV